MSLQNPKKPQVALYDNDTNEYFYPLTTASQVIMEDGSRLNGYLNNNVPPFKFGIDENGNYGYIKDGADTVTPFLDGRYINTTKITNIPFEIMEKDGATWLKVFYHDVTNSVFFTSIHEMEYLVGETDRFSILGLLNFIKRPEDKYEFLIYYPELGENYWNRWSQTSHPLMAYNGAAGYTAIKINYATNFSGGCSLSAAPASAFADCQNGDSWWFPIGQRIIYQGGTPGMNGKVVKKTYLYLRIK